MSGFAIGAIFWGGALLLAGVALILLRRRLAQMAEVRRRKAGADPTFLFTAQYIAFVGIFGAALGVAAIFVGLTR